MIPWKILAYCAVLAIVGGFVYTCRPTPPDEGPVVKHYEKTMDLDTSLVHDAIAAARVHSSRSDSLVASQLHTATDARARAQDAVARADHIANRPSVVIPAESDSTNANWQTLYVRKAAEVVALRSAIEAQTIEVLSKDAIIAEVTADRNEWQRTALQADTAVTRMRASADSAIQAMRPTNGQRFVTAIKWIGLTLGTVGAVALIR